MKHLNGIYTQRYNKLRKTDGPLFRGRFKSILVDANEYLLTLSRYIHLNPVVAKIIRQPEQYQWSSYDIYLNLKPAPLWLTTKTTLEQFGSKLQIQKYKAFIIEGLPDNKNKPDSFLDKIRRLPILGSEAFIKKVTEKYLDKNTKLAQSAGKSFSPVPKITTIMQIVANHYNVEISELQIINRGKNRNKPRTIAIYLSCLLSNQKLQSIANEFTMPDPAPSKMIAIIYQI